MRKDGVLAAWVVHKRKQFAKVVRIPLQYLSKRLRDRVAKLPTTITWFFRMKAGDQMAENTFDVIKRNLLLLICPSAAYFVSS